MNRCHAGGFEYDGGTEISPISPLQIQQATTRAVSAGIKSIVVSGIFAPVNRSQEEAAAAIIKEHGKGNITALEMHIADQFASQTSHLHIPAQVLGVQSSSPTLATKV